MQQEQKADGAAANVRAIDGAARTDASVQATIKVLVSQGKITAEQGEQIFWLHGYGLERGLSNRELGECINTPKSTLIQVLSGTYAAADWSNIVRRIEVFRRSCNKDVRARDVGFVETETAKLIFRVCDNAFHDRMPAFLFGASQLGKTSALEEYVRRNNTPQIKYLRCRSGMSHGRLARLLGRVCHLRSLDRKSSSEIVDEIVQSLNQNCLLILDEFHLLIETVKPETARRLVEYIREIYDLTHCGLVVCATKLGLEDLTEGRDAALFDQFLRRGILRVGLPDVPSVKDINAFAAAFRLAPPHGENLAFAKELIKTRGLSTFCGFLAKSQNLATARQSDGEETVFDWAFFRKVAGGFQSLSQLRSDY